jgi:hypothetical protein
VLEHWLTRAAESDTDVQAALASAGLGARLIVGLAARRCIDHAVAVFSRHDRDDLLVTAGAAEDVLRVSLRGVVTVSAVRWCAERQELIMTAVAAGLRVPDAWSNVRGDLRLFRCNPRDGIMHQLYRGYAHDPVCLPGGGYVVHRGGGLTLLDSEGALIREVKVGRFNWGPPSLSVSPDGGKVAWVRWRGDDQKLCVDDLASGRSTQFRTSGYRYAWFDSETLLYIHGTRPRLLDIASGTTRYIGRSLRDQVRDDMTDPPAQLHELAALPADQLWEFYRDLQVEGDDVWFTATLAERTGKRRVDGLFRDDRAGGQLNLVAAMPPNDRIEWFTALPDKSALMGIATYDGTTIVGRRRTTIGPTAEFMKSGWSPLPTSSQPEFGFHHLSAAPAK